MDIEGKILVLVRMRPLSKKEIAKNEVSVWECINDTTIVYKNSRQEHAGFPTTYTFDRVFSGDKSTREVYDEGVKEIALLVVQGINSTIFAYGQTSTGKTYTMKGVTEYAIADIYDYVEKHEERTFVLKFSAIEIYNEAVRDLLSTDSQPLRILDDPTKGIIVEKLKEETVRNLKHLKHLISECEVRRTRETVLNECSSRSHQILKLTVESSDKEFSGKGNTTKLSASLNFVDLAGSERASQAMSSESKLKEGRHINRSLLTLGTVIRKLSKGKQGHVNYRDSKLTRILQSSLGGNARTAVICTLSPAISHAEQSRNTLLFASCAKEVSTKATVNVVIPGNYLVQQLQNKISRLEIELENKNLQIKQMDKDIREISRQRELAESRVEELLLDIENLRSSAKMENQSSNRNITAENVEEILPRREEQTWENRLSSSLFDGDSLFRSSSFSRASTEKAFVEALVQNLQASEEGGVPSVHSFVKVLKEAQAHFERQPESQGAPLDEKLQNESSDAVTSEQPEARSISNWPQDFARQREAIVNLWQSCNVSLVHRTYFFLLFKGDPSDSIYMEVELRRLTFLKQTYSAEHQLPEDDHRTIGLSAKALYQERKKLSKLMQKRYAKEERNILFQKWGIELESKERKLQLLNSIWTNADDLQHIAQSAEIVARLIKFSEQGKGIKGMLGLSFDSPPRKRRSVSWRSGSWRESIASLI